MSFAKPLVSLIAVTCLALLPGINAANAPFCGPGLYLAGADGSGTCVACPTSTSSAGFNSIGATLPDTTGAIAQAVCVLCDAGFYGNQLIPANSFLTGTPPTLNANPTPQCTPCPLGFTSVKGSGNSPSSISYAGAQDTCFQCPAGTYGTTSATTGGSVCVGCPPGQSSYAGLVDQATPAAPNVRCLLPPVPPTPTASPTPTTPTNSPSTGKGGGKDSGKDSGKGSGKDSGKGGKGGKRSLRPAEVAMDGEASADGIHARMTM